MLIAIDGNEANVKEKVGVHQYAFEILWGLYKLSKKGKSKTRIVVFLKKEPRSDMPKESASWKYRVLPGKGLWILTKLMPHLLFSKQKTDVFFTPSHYLPPIVLCPKVCVIHDLGYLEFSGQFKKYDFWQLKVWTAISIFISNYIISVSHATQKDIMRHYNFASGKTKVIYHGYDKSRFNTKVSDKVVRRVANKYKIKGKYLLFLSTLKPSKNIEGILEAFSLLKNKYKDYTLVIAGKKGWLYDEIFEKVKKLGIKKRVIFTGFIKEDDKPALLVGADVFLSPSFWEGFGIHVLEAMACGTPVVVSKIGALGEVAGEAGVYVDAKNSVDIARGIQKILGVNKKGYNMLVKKGKTQATKFSWEKAARETLKVLKSAVG